METRAHIKISGLVQGIFYRSTIRNRARLLQVKGWIKNLSDGDVEGLFEGEKKDVESLIEFCKSGHPKATIVDVIVQWEEPKYLFEQFEIR